MSYDEFRDFTNQAVALDVQERIELITFLVKSLPQTVAKDDHALEVEKVNAVLDRIPLSEQLEFCDTGLETVREALKNDSW